MTVRHLTGFNAVARASTGAPTTGTWEVGDVVADSAGTYWRCTAAGSPGTWVELGGSAGATAWWSLITNPTPIAVTSSITATIGRLHIVSGTSADYTIPLPAAASNSGQVVGFIVKDWSAANKQFTLDAGATGSPKIAGRTRYLVLLHTNVVLLYSDGTDWQPLVLNLDTPWVVEGLSIINGSTTNPTKATVINSDEFKWRRVGDSMMARWYYSHTSATGAAIGNGTYLFMLPSAYVMDTGKLVGEINNNDINVVSVGVGRTYASTPANGVGVCYARLNSLGVGCIAMRLELAGTQSLIGSAAQPINTAGRIYDLSATVPITNW